MEEGGEMIHSTPHGAKVPIDNLDADEWHAYVLKVLKALRVADKSNWHHRMSARVGQQCNS